MKIISLGLMTGSSMDGIDAVIIETNGRDYVRHIAGASLNFSPSFHLALRAAEFAMQGEHGDLQGAKKNFPDYLQIYLKNIKIKLVQQETIVNNISIDTKSDQHLNILLPEALLSEEITMDWIIDMLTIYHANLVEDLLSQAGLVAEHINVIGFHGQNLYHNPAQSVTIQIGDGQKLADLMKIQVVNNFRENDIKNGGQGAPFAPLYHQLLAVSSGSQLPLAVVNCGGIANITIVSGRNAEQVTGFDTGPGSVLLDRYVRQKTGNQEFMDKDGKYGLAGKPDNEVFALLKNTLMAGENFWTKKPPKSLDSSNFILPEKINDLSIEDACSTLAYFTAWSIAGSIDIIPGEVPKLWVLAGGGWNNPIITKFFKEELYKKMGNNIILTADEIGWNGKYMEAEIFAYLAVRNLLKLPISYPAITGVKSQTLGGILSVPST